MVFGMFSAPSPYKGQSYHSLKKTAQQSGHPFIDPEFPPDDKNLFYTTGKLTGVVWKRPKDICANPKLFVEGADSNDVSQGRIGNCWFVAACSSLAIHKEIWQKVIPDHKEQEWDDEHPENYAGIFHFQFWRYGEWVDVVIDDMLPTLNNELIFCHSKSRNEFWSALLEKAFAKIFGCYEALDGGELAEALEDFTGGIAEPIDIVEGKYHEDEAKRDELYRVMKKEADRKSLMAAAIPAKSSDEMEQSTDIGLVKGHAYGITAVKKVAIAGSGLFSMFNQEKLHMIRLRNPWGGSEWKGPFSDGSPEWNKIDKASRDKIGLTFDEDGEFWMTMDDYCKYFTNMSICRVVNTSFFSLSKTWDESLMHGEWRTPNRAGGCLNNRETMLNNPQFTFKIDDTEGEEILIGLTQKSSRGQQDQKLTIGYSVMKVEDNRHYRIHQPQEIVKSSTFKNARTIFMRQHFGRGRYLVLPSTFDAGHQGEFLLRVYSKENNHGRELALDKPSANPLASLCKCFLMCKYPVIVTRIRVIRAVGLQHQDTAGGADPYAIIRTEGEVVRTPTVKDNLNPEWDVTAIFYRKKPLKKPVKVEIWNSNIVRDSFMGRHLFQASDEVSNKSYEVDPFDRKKGQETTKMPGRLFVQITTVRTLEAL